MVVDMVNLTGPSLVEVVHIELSDEGGEVIVLEVKGEDLVRELSGLEDGDRGAILVPVDDIGEFSFLEDVVGFFNERGDEGRLGAFELGLRGVESGHCDKGKRLVNVEFLGF